MSTIMVPGSSKMYLTVFPLLELEPKWPLVVSIGGRRQRSQQELLAIPHRRSKRRKYFDRPIVERN